MSKTGEPGHCYNFFENERDTLRNACAEFTSEDDSDVCNLGSINLGNIPTIGELNDVVSLASKFLVCGTIRGDLPYEKVKEVREKNRKLGLGLMGVHEWLLQRGYNYEVNTELKQWLEVYKNESERAAREHCDRFYISHPKKFRAAAPAGTIGILASTTTGIEPLYSVAYKRRYLEGGSRWKYQYVIDATAERLIQELGIDPDKVETAFELAKTPEKRIKFQYEVQKYVDMGISSTLNLPAWGSEFNNPDTVIPLAETIAKYCHGLRGLTCYPDGGRGAGQPLTVVSYEEAKAKHGIIYEEENKCSGGVCGI
jgi:ribonucleoside-diphosphate reductase alpha chain